MKNSKIVLFPRIFKLIGTCIVLIAIIIFCIKLFSGIQIAEFINFDTDIRIYAIYAILILGFFLIAFSKEKFEDELIAHFRIRAVLITTILHSIFFFIFTFTSLTLHFINFPAIILMNSLFFFYIITFNILKFHEKFKNRNNDNFD
jgi:hypothetical protein